jgi:glutaconate CoA-transferase subunit A
MHCLATPAAIVDQIEDGMSVGIGGMINTCHAMSLVREIIRQERRGLTGVGMASGIEMDMLIAAGCVDTLATPGVSAESIKGITPAFRKRAEEGTLEVQECDEGIVHAALLAGAERVPYHLWRGGLATSYPKLNPWVTEINDELTGGPVLAVQALTPDVALIHAARSDAFGNIQFEGGGFADRLLARASRKVVVSVERVVPNETIRATAALTTIPGADAVVYAPYGAHPFGSPGHYVHDVSFIEEWVTAAEAWRTEDDFGPVSRFFDRYVFEPEDDFDYLDRVGLRRLLELSEARYVIDEAISAVEGTDDARDD